MHHKIRGDSELFYDWIDAGWISNHVAFSATAEITYKIAVGPAPEISASENIVCAGDTIQCSVSGGTSPYSWSSSDELIATVDVNGLVTTLTTGEVTITVSDYYECDDSLEINAVRVRGGVTEAGSGRHYSLSLVPGNGSTTPSLSTDEANTVGKCLPALAHEAREQAGNFFS